MDRRKKWQATKIVVGQKEISHELYARQILELTQLLYNVFANQSKTQNEKKKPKEAA